MVARLLRPIAVPITMPSTSPMAHPVRQWTVALKAVWLSEGPRALGVRVAMMGMFVAVTGVIVMVVVVRHAEA